MMLVDPFRFAGSNPATLEFLNFEPLPTPPGTETSLLIPNYPIGDPRDDRRVFIAVHLYRPVPLPDPVGGMIGAEPLLIHAYQTTTLGGVSPIYGQALIASARAPSGTVADITVDFSGTVGGGAFIAAYRATDLRQDAAYDARQMVGNTPSNAYPMVISTPQDGFVIAAAAVRLAGDGGEVLGTTTQYSRAAGGYSQFGGGDLTADDPAHQLTFSMVGGPSFGTMEGAFVAASFR